MGSTISNWGPITWTRAQAPKTQSGAAYEQIRADIISGRLKPGTKLLSERVKAQYGVGSSPLREALSHLTASGLVRAEDQKGFRVVEVSLGELIDVARLRLRLEIQAIEDSVRQGDLDWEVEVVSCFHRLQHAVAGASRDNDRDYATEWEDSHRAFHFAIMGACGSPWLKHFCDRLYDQTERYRRIFVKYQKIPSDLLREHKQMMELALARNIDGVCDLMRSHIIYAAELTERDMRAAGVMDADRFPTGIRQLVLPEMTDPQVRSHDR
ncbi:MAG: FCD domain-containing protein [Aquisalimonadaceae bacterium]